MWLVRLKMLKYMPRARARPRFSVGPSLTMIRLTTRASSFWLKLLVALAAADFTTLPISWAAALGVKSSTTRASLTGMPMTVAATSRALRGGMRM